MCWSYLSSSEAANFGPKIRNEVSPIRTAQVSATRRTQSLTLFPVRPTARRAGDGSFGLRVPGSSFIAGDGPPIDVLLASLHERAVATVYPTTRGSEVSAPERPAHAPRLSPDDRLPVGLVIGRVAREVGLSLAVGAHHPYVAGSAPRRSDPRGDQTGSLPSKDLTVLVSRSTPSFRCPWCLSCCRRGAAPAC